MKLKLVAYLFVFCVSLSSIGQAESLTVGIGLSKPPYVIQERNEGAEYEIVQRALEIAGYEMTPRYMPMLRIPHEINGGGIDGGMNMRAHIRVDGFFSDVVMVYHNYAISLAEEDLDLKTMGDLKDKSVVAFQNAHKLLGEEFSDTVKENKKYAEISRQVLQVKMLAAKRVQVVVADFRIFLHFKKELEKKTGKKLKVAFHKLFQPTPYRVAFRSRVVRDKFDVALVQLKTSGEYDRILEKYITKDDLKELTTTK